MTTNKSHHGEFLVSADSHVIEPPSVWKGLLEPEFWGTISGLTETRGVDPTKRREEMKRDGVGAEVLYPTLGLHILSIEDPELQEASCRAYNEWLTDFCSADPERLVGIGIIPCYRSDIAVKELNFCHEHGLRGGMIWQTPHPDLPFTGSHYDPIFAEAERLGLPLNVHILTGFNYSRAIGGRDSTLADERLRRIHGYYTSVNEKISCTAETLLAFIFGGAFERFPGLRLAIVENELSWLPFYLDQWDYYYRRYHLTSRALEEVKKPPSEYFDGHVFVTFFRDPWAGHILSKWGKNCAMWSNDFPHPNSTWPNSQGYVEQNLGFLDADTQNRVLRQNCSELYRINSALLTK